MLLTIDQRESEGVILLDLSGDVVLGSPDADLRERLRSLRVAGKINIALNLAHVDAIDSAGLGTLTSALVSLTKLGGNLMLYNLHPAHLSLLLLTKLYLVFQLFAREEDAVDACFPDRAVKHYDILEFLQSNQRDHWPPTDPLA